MQLLYTVVNHFSADNHEQNESYPVVDRVERVYLLKRHSHVKADKRHYSLKQSESERHKNRLALIELTVNHSVANRYGKRIHSERHPRKKYRKNYA